MIKKIVCVITLSVCLSLIAAAGLPVKKDGWPVTFVTDGHYNSALNVGDIDGDGDMEVFIGKPMASLYQFYQHDGTWLCEYSWSCHNWQNAAFCDFDGDGREEMVLGGHGCQNSFNPTSNGILKWDGAEWSTCEGWNQSSENSVGHGFAVADLDNDGEMEIVAACGPQGAVYVWNSTGEKKQGFPTARNEHRQGYFCPMVQLGDITGDGNLEIVHRHYKKVRVLKTDGNSLSGWPKNGELYGLACGGFEMIQKQCSLADINGDGKCEILQHLGESEYFNLPNRVAAWQADGSNLAGWPCEISFSPGSNRHNDPPIAGDMDGDGRLEVAVCSATHNESHICLIDSAGNLLWEKSPEKLLSHLVMGDIDNDGVQEVVGCSNDQLFAWHKDGSSPAGFPMTIDLGSDDHWSPPDLTFPTGRIILEDIDNDGRIEMILAMVPANLNNSRLSYFVVYDCDTAKEAGAVQWGYKFFNRRNTGCYEKP